jgi:tetratricopeptide (TPR) repeat protein
MFCSLKICRFGAFGGLTSSAGIVTNCDRNIMPKKAPVRKKLNRQEKRDLDIEIGFLEGLVRRDPGYVDALQILGDDYTKRGKFTLGLKIDQRLAVLRPRDALVYYNLACSYCLTGKMDEAAEAIEQALNFGYRDFKWLSEDPDLVELREHDAYDRVRGKIKSLRVKVH